jgi:CubicO group peptidase (beta-lactamase class C family)
MFYVHDACLVSLAFLCPLDLLVNCRPNSLTRHRVNSLLRLSCIFLFVFLFACSDDEGGGLEPPIVEKPAPDFSAVDAALDAFVAEHPAFDGASIIIVDEEDGAIHEAAFGDHTLDTVVLLASTSKMPSVSLLMALAEDDANVDFEMDAVIDQYLPWPGYWTGRTTEQLVSNTSGIPGLFNALNYGAHLCQFFPVGQLQTCGQIIYQTPLDHLPSNPPGQEFDYGGSQWHLAGTVAEIVGGASWRQLFDQYLAGPCELEVFQYGNNLSFAPEWSGSPDDLAGLDNPNIEGGAISNLGDYAKILSMQLNEGQCGDTQVLSPAAISSMRIDRGTPANSQDWLNTGRGYGMGWWILPTADDSTPYIYLDPGAFSSSAWIDTRRDYGAYVQMEDYTAVNVVESSPFITEELIPLIEAALDAANE